MVEDAAKLKVAEMLLRKKIASALFPNPVEGTNKYPLAEGYVLNLQHKIDRTLDEAVFMAMRDEFASNGIAVNDIVERKPALKLAVYRELTEGQAKLFDNALTIKPASPSMKIELPASAKKKEA